MKKIFLFDIDEEKGLGCKSISHVEAPAIESNFVCFSEESEEIESIYQFKLDDEKMRIAGAVLIPNKEMYRKRLGGYAMFTSEAVEKVRNSYKKNNNNFAINLEHSEVKSPAFVLEDWIVENPQSDKSKAFGEYPEGTWFAVHQITDRKYWDEKVKTGIVKGFSIELDLLSAKIKEAPIMENTNLEKETPEVTETVETKETVATDNVDVKLAEEVIVEPARTEVIEEPKKEFVTKEEVTNMLSDVMSRLEKLELELTKKEEVIEELSKQVETAKTKGQAKSFTKFAKEEDKDIPFSQRMKEKIFSQNN